MASQQDLLNWVTQTQVGFDGFDGLLKVMIPKTIAYFQFDPTLRPMDLYDSITARSSMLFPTKSIGGHHLESVKKLLEDLIIDWFAVEGIRIYKNNTGFYGLQWEQATNAYLLLNGKNTLASIVKQTPEQTYDEWKVGVENFFGDKVKRDILKVGAA